MPRSKQTQSSFTLPAMSFALRPNRESSTADGSNWFGSPVDRQTPHTHVTEQISDHPLNFSGTASTRPDDLRSRTTLRPHSLRTEQCRASCTGPSTDQTLTNSSDTEASSSALGWELGPVGHNINCGFSTVAGRPVASEPDASFLPGLRPGNQVA